jgi:hypothetical protein
MKSTGAWFAGVAAALALGAGSVAQAAATYDYTGNAFSSARSQDVINDPSLGTQISGQFTLDVSSTFTGSVTAADLLNWSMTSGAYTLDAAKNAIDDFNISFVNGVVESWDIGASVNPLSTSCCTVQLLTENDDFHSIPELDAVGEAYSLGGGLVATSNDFNSTFGNPGTWTVASAVPEPATWAMMLVGLFGLGVALRFAGRAKAGRAATA